MEVAYLLAKAVDDSSWSGGLLLTDERGLPLDFRYVEPIRPGKLQKLIYGDALKRYLLLDAIASTLLKDARIEADWLFTTDPLLLELDSHVKGRFISVSNGERQVFKKPGEWQFRAKGEIVFQAGINDPAVKLQYNADDEAGTEEIARDLAWLAEQFDFTEPLERVESALKEICKGRID